MREYSKVQDSIPRSSWVGTDNDAEVHLCYTHRYPLTKRAGFAFNRIAPAAQAERHSNKSAVNPANTLATRPFVIPVSDAETGTLYGITEVEWNRNSER